MGNYRKCDCYKCANEKCDDDFSQFIPSFAASCFGIVECENYQPVQEKMDDTI